MNQRLKNASYDRYVLLYTFALLAIGFLMVTSASMVISDKQFGTPYHYLIRQGAYATLALMLCVIVTRIPIKFWERIGPLLLILSIVLLVAVLIPGVGRQVNGSTRWINLGPLTFQVSEFVKLAVILYLASYLVRREDEVRTQISGFIKPMIILSLISFLLLLEPDFGAAVVILGTAMCMMFLAGIRIWPFLVLLGFVAASLGVLAITSPYRLLRLTSFVNPWADQFNSGYQLTQSLIAFGRGGWFGNGLGESVQKLFYLPEAHTDFLFAVLAEEMGLIGISAVILLFVLLVGRGLQIGRTAYVREKFFAAYTAYGISLWLGLQALINIGVNAGVLPTKGLTLPLISYGGNSLLVNCIAIAILLRIDMELRVANKPQKATLRKWQ